MSAHDSALLVAGVEPPPDRSEPRFHVVIRLWSLSTDARSAWVIWPTFSASVIRDSRSRTRLATGSLASR